MVSVCLLLPSISIVNAKVAGWRSLSVSSFSRKGKGDWVAVGLSLSLSPSVVKVRAAGWWSLFVSFYR